MFTTVSKQNQIRNYGTTTYLRPTVLNPLKHTPGNVVIYLYKTKEIVFFVTSLTTSVTKELSTNDSLNISIKQFIVISIIYSIFFSFFSPDYLMYLLDGSDKSLEGALYSFTEIARLKTFEFWLIDWYNTPKKR